MSSVQLWEDRETGILVEWDKHEGYLIRTGRHSVGDPANNVVDYVTKKSYPSAEAAVDIARRKAKSFRKSRGLPLDIPPYEPIEPDEPASPAP